MDAKKLFESEYEFERIYGCIVEKLRDMGAV